MMISALTHDCDHPGLNNSFQHKAGTRVCTLNRVYRSLQAPAMLHQKSTLENHHLIQCMQILSLPECNILQNLDSNEKEALKLYIRHLILATDLSLHGSSALTNLGLTFIRSRSQETSRAQKTYI